MKSPFDYIENDKIAEDYGYTNMTNIWNIHHNDNQESLVNYDDNSRYDYYYFCHDYELTNDYTIYDPDCGVMKYDTNSVADYLVNNFKLVNEIAPWNSCNKDEKELVIDELTHIPSYVFQHLGLYLLNKNNNK